MYVGKKIYPVFGRFFKASTALIALFEISVAAAIINE